MAMLLNGADFGRRLGARGDAFRFAQDQSVMLAGWANNFLQNKFFIDDFTGDTLNGDPWALATDAGATAFTIPGTKLLNGAISGATGASDNEGLAITGAPILRGNNNCGMAIRWKSDIVTALGYEVGLTDPLTDETLPAIADNSASPPVAANGGTDVAVITRDPDSSTTTTRLVTDGTAITAQGVSMGTYIPTAATYQTMIVQCEKSGSNVNVHGYILDANGGLVANGYKTLTTCLDGTILLQPKAIFYNTDTNTKAIDVDFIAYWQDR